MRNTANMKRIIEKVLCRAAQFLGAAGCLFLLAGETVYADTQLPVDVQVTVQGKDTATVHGIGVSYENNNYVSLLDIQKLLEGTEKEFSISLGESYASIVLNGFEADAQAYAEENEFELPEPIDSTREPSGWTSSEKDDFKNKAAGFNKLRINGRERRYFTILTNVGKEQDCFIQISDLCMLLDMNATQSEGDVYLEPSEAMQAISPAVLEQDGYFQGVNGVLVGDATTGEIFYGYHKEEVYPIASTTKLMTYAIYADAVERDEISEQDTVYISEVAEALAKTSDGVIPVKAGQSYPMKELLEAALIVSSNECDHAISEHVAGEEENVVRRMNEKAAELQMNTAEFYNCNGLPVFTKELVPAKKQNRMSCEDMFKLCSYLLNHHPQIKEITSVKKIEKGIMDKELKNTNPVLYNMDEVTGLKTGTTNKSGACLVTSLLVNDGSVNHDLVVVVLGAEGSQDRGRVSELLARYGKAVVLGTASKTEQSENEEQTSTISANSIVNLLVNRAFQLKSE